MLWSNYTQPWRKLYSVSGNGIMVSTLIMDRSVPSPETLQPLPILLSSEKLPADTYLDGISPTAMPTLYYWINFHRAQHKGMHGNVGQALCLSFYKFRSTASCQLLASFLLCHTSTLWPESSPYVLSLWNCSVVPMLINRMQWKQHRTFKPIL